MTAEWILKVFTQAFDEPRDALQGVRVVAGVSDALPDEHQALIAAITTGLNGLTFPLAELGRRGVPGSLTARPDLETTVQGYMRRAVPPGATLTFDATEGLVRATFGSGRDQSDAAPIILGAAVLPFAQALTATELVTVVWDDSALDAQSAEAVWNLLMDFDQRHLGRLQRVLLFASGQLRMDLHADSPKPTRFWVHRNTMDEVKPPAHLVSRIEHLRQLNKEDRPLVLFLGAGFSMASGDDPGSRLPLGDALRDEALVDMFGSDGTAESRLNQFYDVVESADLWTPAERARPRPSRAEFISRLTLERVLLVEFADQGAQTRSPTLVRFRERNASIITAPSVGVRRLGDLIRLGTKLVLLTVNFDTLVEAVAGDAVQVLSTPGELATSADVVATYLDSDAVSGSAERRVPLLKLHGTIDALDTVVADVNSVATGFPRGVSNALESLTSEEQPFPWIYVGHSMRDRDVMTVVEQRNFAVGTDELWVSPALPVSVREFAADHRSPHWLSHGLGIRHVTVTSDRFLTELLQRWSA